MRVESQAPTGVPYVGSLVYTPLGILVIEGSHQTFYYVLEDGVVNVYIIAKGVGQVLKTYNFDEATGDELHKLTRGRVDLDRGEIHRLDRELSR